MNDEVVALVLAIIAASVAAVCCFVAQLAVMAGVPRRVVWTLAGLVAANGALTLALVAAVVLI